MESENILALITAILSPKAPPVEDFSKFILAESDAVSRANLVVSIEAVSEIFNFKFIRPLSALELSTNEVFIFVESLRILFAKTVESFKILLLKKVTLSDNAPSVAEPNKSILFDKEAVSRAKRLLNIADVSNFCNNPVVSLILR